MREKLIDTLENIGIYEVTMNAELIADHLIANNVVVREKGEWEWKLVYGTDRLLHNRTVCSLCGATNKQYQPPFCPHCGADMRAGG